MASNQSLGSTSVAALQITGTLSSLHSFHTHQCSVHCLQAVLWAQTGHVISTWPFPKHLPALPRVLRAVVTSEGRVSTYVIMESLLKVPLQWRKGTLWMEKSVHRGDEFKWGPEGWWRRMFWRWSLNGERINCGWESKVSECSQDWWLIKWILGWPKGLSGYLMRQYEA